MKLVFATHNENKFNEVKVLMPSYIELVSLTDIGCFEDIPETGKTLEENAKIKADFVTKTYNLPCFADDTGLIVDSLNGDPGVYSARYAGPQKNAEDNMNKLLNELKKHQNRSARFKTAIALNLKQSTSIFLGEVEGQIISEKTGTAGFGYDPIFKPNGYDQTFAELSLAIKNSISHRGLAIQKLVKTLKSIPHE